MMCKSGGYVGVLVAAGLVLAPTGAAAQDTIGEIVATLDGEARAWRALDPDGSGTDYNTRLEAFGPMQGVSIMGFPPGEITTRGSVQITFTVMSGDEAPFDQEVIYAPEGMSRMWTSLEGEDLITLERFAADGAQAEVAGRIAGRLCLKESLFADPDPDTCKTIEGRFASALPPPVD